MSIQQRLLQREPLDPWSVREQLCLASAVCRSGDQNWMSVSRALRAAGDPTRPQDWYQQKYCAAQYGALLEGAETPKRKKRTSEGAAETPQEAILKRLTAERIAELQKLMQDYKTQYAVIKEEVSEIRNPTTSDARLREILGGIEAARRAREREQQRQAQWLRDREQRRRSGEKARRVSLTPAGAGVSPPASSPLLSSLLNNTSPGAGPVSVTQMLHIPHPSHIQDTTSPSASAPTLSQLLEKGRALPPPPPPPASDAAVIEQIKSELQQIENNLRMGNIPVSAPPVMNMPESAPEKNLDIDDIEIKAEDVYAFRDMDLEIQPVSTIHKAVIGRSIEKLSPSKKDEEPAMAVPVDSIEVQPLAAVEIKQEETEPVSVPEEEAASQPVVEETVTAAEPRANEQQREQTSEQAAPDTVIEKPLEPVGQLEPPPEEKETEGQPEQAEEQEKEMHDQPAIAAAEEIVAPPEEECVVDEEDEEVNVTALSDAPEESIDNIQQHIASGEDTVEEEIIDVSDVKAEVTGEDTLESQLEEDGNVTADSELEVEKEEVEEKQEDELGSAAVERHAKPSDTETHTETDDDTPMQVIREEEKQGRKRRDYSRRKTQILSESRGASGSESAAESAPASPRAAPEPDKEHRLWKKSVMLVYNRLCAHKYASLFLRPITDDVAPDYSLVVKRPMDLTTIKKNIDSGAIRTTAEFQRDVLLMLSNALLYNSSRHRVHHMAQEMHQEAVAQLGMLLQAQAHAGLGDSRPPARRPHPPAKRKRVSSPSAAPTKRLREE